MNIKIILFIGFLFAIISCKKEKSHPSIKELTNIKNYTIIETKINDSISKIIGENKNYIIEGKLNKKENKKDGWWKIRNKNINEIYEIEYLIFDKEKLNQIKIYVDGNLVKSASRFYESKFSKNNFQIKIYFPDFAKEDKQNVEITYYLADLIQMKVSSQIKAKMEKRKNFYFLEIPLTNDENSIIGYSTKFSSKNLKNDSIELSAETLYFKDNIK